jgi:hypothetical protein
VVELRIIDVEVGRNVWVWSVHRPSNTTIVGVLAPAYVESGPVQEKRGVELHPQKFELNDNGDAEGCMQSRGPRCART